MADDRVPLRTDAKIREVASCCNTASAKWARRLTVVVVYYGVACLFYCHVEGWSILQACYWTTVTVTTVGYGDVVPTTRAGKLFGIPFILFGLVVIFQVMYSVAGNIIDAAAAAKRKRRARAGRPESIESTSRRHLRTVLVSVGSIAGTLLCGALYMWATHEFSFVDSIWWSFVTLTTVGYGDVELRHRGDRDNHRVFTIFFIYVATICAAMAIGNLGAVGAEMARERKEAEVLARLDFGAFASMGLDPDGKGVGEDEYVIAMLRLLDVVDETRIESLRKQFRAHDTNSSGTLDKNDLREISLDSQKRATEVLKHLNNPLQEPAQQQRETDTERDTEMAPVDSGDSSAGDI
jgi:hypothetical protein